MPGYITLTELAERLGMNTSTLRRWCKAGKLNAEKYGKTWLVKESDIPADLKRDKRGRQPAPPRGEEE
jgi:excisionase family DNA binding protein